MECPDRESLHRKIHYIVQENPLTIIHNPDILSYLSSSERQECAEKIIHHPSNIWIRGIKVLQKILPNDQLREKIIQHHTKSPWDVYIKKDDLTLLFTEEYFQHILEKNGVLTTQEFEMFLLFHAHQDINRYSGKMREMLQTKAAHAPTIDVELHGEREAGFGCGGMERNFFFAAQKGKGICLVNNALFAKFYHTK